MPKLLYFPLHGRALKIRMLCKHANIAISDENPGKGDWKEWADLKQEFPDRGGLPWFINDDGKVFTQSDAILKTLALQAGYKCDDPWQQFESEWCFETANDYMKKDGILTPFFSPAFGGPEATEE